MNLNTKELCFSLLLFICVAVCACNSSSKEDKKNAKDSIKSEAKKETKQQAETKFQRPPIVNIVDTLTTKLTVIYSTDSAATFDRISLKLGKIYGVKLPEYIKKNSVKTTGAPMAWYTKQPEGSGGKAPYFFEAGIPVNKAGAKALAGVQIREMAAGKAVIAHFFGPFDLLPQGYDAIREFIKDNKKTITGAPYEIYLSDPFDKNGKPIDPYKVQTDIVFPVK